MKTIMLFPSMVIISACINAQPTVHNDHEKTGTLLVLVTGFKSTEGSLMVAVLI
jgi:hypothetical protein